MIKNLIKSIFDNSARVSGERIWTEWAKILVGNHGGQLTKCMIEVGLIHIKKTSFRTCKRNPLKLF